MDELNPERQPVDGPRHRVPQPQSAPSAEPVPTTAKRKRPLKHYALALGGLLLLVGLGFALKLLLAGNEVISTNHTRPAPALEGEIDPSKLKGEGDGRINILLLGIGGAGHQGGTLSDTMMVLSLDPRTKHVAMLGLPRDLYVPIPGYG